MDLNNKIKLSVLGFSFNQTQSGAYGLVLAEEDGSRRLMVVVGAPEAQSIAFRLQNVIPPRPLTHDLFKEVLDSFYIVLEEVIINDYVEGVFHSKLVLRQGDLKQEIDSRTSDAVAIALRVGAPIFTTERIMKDLGVVIDDFVMEDVQDSEKEEVGRPRTKGYSLLSTAELQEMLKDALKEEDYELASILRDEIQKKKNPDS